MAPPLPYDAPNAKASVKDSNPHGWWQRQILAGIAAASEATFPENDFGAPDWKSTRMVDRTVAYLEELPPPQRRLIGFLYGFIEIAAVVLVFGLRRFSRHPAARRTECVRAWRASRLAPLRLLGDAVKATTTMIYMSHPSVITHIGEYRACSHEQDPLQIEARPRALDPGAAE